MSSDEKHPSKLDSPGSPELAHHGDNADGLQRRLDNRQIQLIAIGGSIGTALFVSIGGALARGGAGSLFVAYTLYTMVLALVNNSCAEMSTYMPVSGGFIRIAGHWVDDALGFMAGWNFFLYEAILIPFEITALCLVLSFWNGDVTDAGPTAGVCAGVIICYALLNVLAVRYYGEAEFWLSGGKIILILILFCFTFITMCGGNPKKDAYGFSHFTQPEAFLPYRSEGSKGRFEGFLAALWSASFTVVGPEYISLVAAEAKRPSIYIKAAFKTVYYRFCVFFVLGSLAIGIVLPSNDPALQDIYFGEGGKAGAGASPYVIAMENLGIGVLPHIVNFLMFTSIFSAGNTYTYAATRSLYSLALEGRAPRFLRKCTNQGVPIYCFCIVMLFPFLAFLQCSNSSGKVLTWLINIVTAGGLINYLVMSVTFICYYRACQAQGIDRKTMPYYGRFQPYSAYIALTIQSLVVLFYGYTAFGPPSVEGFFTNYSMQIIAALLFVGWKVFKRTRMIKPHEVDLTWERPIIDAYENSITTPPTGFWTEMLQLIGIGRNKNRHLDD